MGIQSRNSNSGIWFTSTQQKLTQQFTNAHDLLSGQLVSDLTYWHVCCDECDRERTAGEAHSKILYLRARGKEFRLSGKMIPDLMQCMFADRAGDDGIPFTR